VNSLAGGDSFPSPTGLCPANTRNSLSLLEHCLRQLLQGLAQKLKQSISHGAFTPDRMQRETRPALQSLCITSTAASASSSSPSIASLRRVPEYVPDPPASHRGDLRSASHRWCYVTAGHFSHSVTYKSPSGRISMISSPSTTCTAPTQRALRSLLTIAHNALATTLVLLGILPNGGASCRNPCGCGQNLRTFFQRVIIEISRCLIRQGAYRAHRAAVRRHARTSFSLEAGDLDAIKRTAITHARSHW